MVRDAPTITSVLPMFLEFAHGAVLVAHNAGFDIGFLKAAAEQCGIAWPRPPVLCTVRLARRALSREEAPSVRLAALARLVGAATTPTHRALDDARATVDVLHALIARVGNQGVSTYSDLKSLLPRCPTPSAASGCWRRGCRIGPASIYSADRVPRCSTSEPRATYADGCCSTSPAPTPRAHEGNGRAGRGDRPCRVRSRPGSGRARTPTAGRARSSVQPPLALSAALVVGGAHRRGIPRLVAVRTLARTGPSAPSGPAVTHWTPPAIARFTGLRTCTTRIGRNAQHGPACPQREVAPCPAVHGVSAADYAIAPCGRPN